jgi:dephospho-CoA kinase
MQSQLPLSETEGRADDVLANEGDPEALKAAVDALHRRYLHAAIKKSP